VPGGRADTIQRLFDAINAGGSEAVLAFFDPAVVWDMSAAQMPGVEDVYRGHDGLLRYLEWQELFGDLQYEIVESEEAADNVLVYARVSGTGRTSGAAVDAPFALIYTFDGDLITRTRNYFDQGAAERTFRGETGAGAS
jgi:ketosteroid isomerase-like protein